MRADALLVLVLFALAGLLARPASAAEPVRGSPPAAVRGQIERWEGFASAGLPERAVEVWLPDGYPQAAPYDVLYMHDGQMLFDAARTWNGQSWHMDEHAQHLIDSGAVRPFVIVGVANAGEGRHAEFTPERPWRTLSDDQQRALRGAKRGAASVYSVPLRSDRYLAFLADELKPFVDRNYAVAGGREHTFIAGSSMGGLISLYALVERPQVYGGAACLSTHWPVAFSLDDNPMPDAIVADLGGHLPPPGEHRLWFDHGTETLDALYAPIQQRVDELLRAKGYGEGQFRSRVYPGAPHTEQAWSARVEEALRFLLPRAAPTALHSPEAVAAARH